MDLIKVLPFKEILDICKNPEYNTFFTENHSEIITKLKSDENYINFINNKLYQAILDKNKSEIDKEIYWEEDLNDYQQEKKRKKYE